MGALCINYCSRETRYGQLRRRGQLQRSNHNECEGQERFHRVLKYWIRSFNSSLVRSCLSSGLKTVQISSSVAAEPSCRYGAVMAILVNCGVSSRPVLSVVLRVPTSKDFWFVPLGPLWQDTHWFTSGMGFLNLSTERTNSALPRSCVGVSS